MQDEWTFPAHCTHVVDGDTLDLTVDVGFRMTREVRVRLADADTAEVYGTKEGSEEHERGEQHSQFVREWLASAEGAGLQWPLVVRTEKETGKYGRYIATVERRTDGERLADALKSEFEDLGDPPTR